jgi:transcriptional regulator with XRE-family HTH domain
LTESRNPVIVGATMTERHVVSQRLRQRRRELGLTQQQVVSRLAEAGVRTTNKALSGLEHGVGLDASKLPEVAAALDCSVTYLLRLTDDPHRWEPDAQPARQPTEETAVGVRPWILGPDVPGLRTGSR